MFFTILTFGAALFIEGLGSLVSVIGISALFGSNPIIIALAISLDVGKLVVVSLLYTYWKELSKLMKAYALTAAAVTMIITSAGAAGYLSGAFQTAIMGTKEGELKVNVLKEQQAKYQERKKQIDDQIAKLPEKTTVNQRLRLMNGFKAEQKALDDKITAIDKELPEAQIKQIGIEAKAGPILYIAKAFNISVEEAVKWVIGMIIFVFDPLAIFLIIAGNFLLAHHRANKRVLPFSPPDDDIRVVPREEAFASAVDFNVPSRESHPPLFERMIPSQDVKLPPPEEDHPPSKEEIDLLAHLEKQEEAVVTDEPPSKPEPQPSKATYIPTGLLKPVNVGMDSDEVLPAVADIRPPVPVEPVPVEPVPVEEEVPRREEITRSTLGIIEPDPTTIVDAGRLEGFQTARVITVPKK